jgi:hypothetical protein
MVLRAALFRNGARVSAVASETFIFLEDVIHQPKDPPGFPSGRKGWNGFPADYEMDPQVVNAPEYSGKMKEALRALPTVSLSLPVEDLFGRENGMYLHSVERGEKWERPCSLEMILPDGTTAFQITCGLRIQGNFNRIPQKSPKHSFRLIFRENYGTSKLHYPIFPDSMVRKFDTLILRSDYNNSWTHWDARARPRAQRTRDAWFKDTHRAMGWVAGHNRYVHLYLNGLYWGIYDFAERPDADFAAAYLGGSKEDYDVINEFQVKDGKMDGFQQLSSIHGLASNAQYERLKGLLDVTQYIDYVLINYYAGNQDWGENKNWYAIRRRSTGGPFQFMVWDGEQILEGVNDDTVSSPFEVPFRLTKDLETNPEYRLAFADRVHRHCFGQGALTAKACTARWMKRAGEVDPAVIAESARWGDYRRRPAFTRNKEWMSEQKRLLESYFPRRTELFLGQLRATGLYPPIDAPELSEHRENRREVTFKPPAAGKLYYTIDGSDPRVPGQGAVARSAIEYTNPIPLREPEVIKARIVQGNIWSALTEATP